MFNLFNRPLTPKAMDKLLSKPEFVAHLRASGWVKPGTAQGFDALKALGWRPPGVGSQGGGAPSPPSPKGGGAPSPPAPK